MTERIALVTGASSGIGAASAIELAQSTTHLWLTYASDRDGAEQTATRCRELGSNVTVARLDLRSEVSIEALASELESSTGSLHVLVNNGGTCPYQSIDEITIDDWDAVMETNARGTFLLTRRLLAALRRGAPSDRSVVNISSVAGQVGGITTGIHYAASKAAILGITRTLARHLASEGIRVNAVCPGPVESGITEQLGDDDRSRMDAGIPLGRFGDPGEVAWIVAALADPRSAFVTGASYDVNGGVRIG